MRRWVPGGPGTQLGLPTRLRAAIHEILVKPLDDQPLLEVTIHWQGGVHTRCQVDRPVRTKGSYKQSVEELVRGLAAEVDDREIARVLNMNGTATPSGLRWTQDRVRDCRRQNRITATAGREPRTSMTMNQVQLHLGISHNALLALVRLHLLDPNQLVPFAPWRVSRERLDSADVQRAVAQLKKTGRLPKGGSPIQQPGLFDANTRVATEVKQGAL